MLNLARTLHTIIEFEFSIQCEFLKWSFSDPIALGKQILSFVLQPGWKIHLSLQLNLQSEIIFEGLFFWPALLLLLPFPVCFQGSLLVWVHHAVLSSLGGGSDASLGDGLCPSPRLHSCILHPLLPQTLRGTKSLKGKVPGWQAVGSGEFKSELCNFMTLWLQWVSSKADPATLLFCPWVK